MTEEPARREKAAPKRPPLEVVGPQRRRVHAGLLTVIATLVVFAALFALAVLHAWLVQGQQRLDRLDEQVAEAQTEYQRLRLEVARLESPARVVDAAINQLGMVPAGDTTYLMPVAPVVEDAGAATADDSSGDPGRDAEAAQDNWTTVKPYLGAGP